MEDSDSQKYSAMQSGDTSTPFLPGPQAFWWAQKKIKFIYLFDGISGF